MNEFLTKPFEQYSVTEGFFAPVSDFGFLLGRVADH